MALSTGRATPRRNGDQFADSVGANAVIHPGALVMLNATGYLVQGATATGQVARGVSEESETVDNTGGADGAKTCKVRKGVFRFKNSTSADEITLAEIGDDCYIVDDETVAKTDGTATRSIAGKIEDVDSAGVWVKVG